MTSDQFSDDIGGQCQRQLRPVRRAFGQCLRKMKSLLRIDFGRPRRLVWIDDGLDHAWAGSCQSITQLFAAAFRLADGHTAHPAGFGYLGKVDRLQLAPVFRVA